MLDLQTASFLATPICMIFGVVFAAGKIKNAVDELRRAVDRLEHAVTAIDVRTQDMEQRLSRLEGRNDS